MGAYGLPSPSGSGFKVNSNPIMFNTAPAPTSLDTGNASSGLGSSRSGSGSIYKTFDLPQNAGSNQFMPSMPSIPAGNAPGTVPQSGSPVGGGGAPQYSSLRDLGNGFKIQSPIDPALTKGLENFLQSFLGKGATPFDLSALLPSSGQAGGAGQLSAPLTQMLQQLQGLFSGQTDPSQAGPLGGAFSTLSNVAQNGISAVPTWNTMVDAMQRQIGQGANNLREQFAFAGNLAGSPFANAIQDYQTQSNKDLNSQLAQMQYQGIQDQLGAAGSLMSGGSDLGQFFQGLDQASIDRLYNEFLRTQPEYNPLLGLISGLSTTFQPILSKQYGVGAGAALQGVGSILSGLKDIPGLSSGASSGGGN